MNMGGSQFNLSPCKRGAKNWQSWLKVSSGLLEHEQKLPSLNLKMPEQFDVCSFLGIGEVNSSEKAQSSRGRRENVADWLMSYVQFCVWRVRHIYLQGVTF